MFWLICIVGVSVFLFTRRDQVKKAITIAHYEAIYWILGGAATIEDLVYMSKNKLGDLPKRNHCTAIVTGGSRGIGLEVVKKFLECDMFVVIGCRKVQAGIDAVHKLRGNGVNTGRADVLELDTSSMESVKKFATEVSSKINQLHILVNNAGIMFVPYTIVDGQFESHLAVNYIGHALLTHLLLPLMKETGKNYGLCSRIVHVSSCAHLAGSINFDDMNFTRSTYIPSEAYAQSKLAQIMFSNALNRKLEEESARVCSIAVHPGVVDTQLFDGTLLKRIAPWAPKLLFKTPEEGSRSIVFSALSNSIENEGGIYISNCRKTWTSSYAKDKKKQDDLMEKTRNMLNLSEFCGISK